jgi:chaperonin GroEL
MAKNKWQQAKVVFQPQVHRGMQAGIDQIVDAVRPTLGPFPRIVLYDRTVGKEGKVPELLDDGGTIARRVIQIAGRDADVGAMLVRHMLWQLREEVGDGTATAAVLFDSIYDEGLRYLASGGNAMRLRTHLEAGLRVVLQVLDGMAYRLEGKEDLGKLAARICGHEELGELLGEIFDVIGEYGRLEIRSSRSRRYSREYVEGMYWDGGLLSRSMITDVARQRAELENAAVLITDLDVEDPRALIPTLSICVKSGIEALAIIARSMSDVAVGMLLANKKQQKIKLDVLAAKTPGSTVDAQRAALMDMAVLTNGRALHQSAGDTLRKVKPADLGQVRRIWADKNNVGIVGGKADPRALRQHIADLRALHRNTSDLDERRDVQERIGKLLGGSATLRVGGITKTELDYNKEQAQRAAEAMRGAIREGVVPGGGVALLACQSELRSRMEEADESEARAAYHILLKTMEAPIRALLTNAGEEPGQVMGTIKSAGPGFGYDVVEGKIVDVNEAGILDVTSVIKAAVRSAVSTAAMALTTDVLVHRASAPESLTT